MNPINHKEDGPQNAVLERLILAAVTDYAIITTDLECRITSWNAGATTLFGYTETSMLGQRTDLLFVPEDREPADGRPGAPQQEIERTIREGQAESERWHLRKDGSRFYGSGMVTPLYDGAGTIIGTVKVMRDLTRQKQAEDALRQSEKKYRTLFDSIDEGVGTVELHYDEKGRAVDYHILEQNSSWERLTGLMGDALSKRINEILPNRKAVWFDVFERVARTGEPERVEHEVAGLANNWFDVHVSRADGEASHMVVFVYTNITERKRRDANLAFLADVSQDLARLTNTDDTIATVGAKIGQYMKLSRCAFAEIDEDHLTGRITHDWHQEGLPDIRGVYHLAHFVGDELGQAARAGELFISRDTTIDERVNAEQPASVSVGSFIHVPIIQAGEWRFSLTIYHTTPHDWRDDEIELIRELTTRIWTRLDRARAEDALQESERFVQRIIASLPLVIYIFDLQERRNLFLSPQVEQVFGYRIDEMQHSGSKLIPMYFHPDDLPRISEHLTAVSTSPDNHTFSVECRIRHRDRGWIWVLSRDQVYQRDAEGRPTLMLGTVEDISERKAAEYALRESEQRIRLAIEATELGTWEWNLLTNEVYWNEQHFRLFGMSPMPQPITPDEFFRHIHPNDRDRLKYLLERAIAERGVYEAEFCALLDDGSQRWMSGYGRIVEERDGTPLRMSGVMFDINERRRAEDALRAADQRKNEFLAMLAHELRNPLAPIRNGLQILNLTADPNSETVSLINLMNGQVDHLVRLVDDLLDVSRISRGKIDLRLERVELGAIISGAVEAARPLYRNRRQTLHLQQLPTALYLNGDATRLAQVMTNLLTNGTRYTHEGGDVRVVVEQADGEVLLRVADNGIGLPPEQVEAIFDLFVQVDNSVARTQGGLGLGLTLVRRIVEMHGGHVEAYSMGLGQGSEFRVYLPLLPKDKPTNDSQAMDKSNTPAGKQPLLLIDDNADAALTLAMLLKLKGYLVHTRTSGRTGLEAAEQLRPTAILLDLGMPDLDGYETCRLLRQQPWGKQVPVIALTGYGQDEDKQRTKEAGFDAHLVKPVDLAALLQQLAQLVDKQS